MLSKWANLGSGDDDVAVVDVPDRFRIIMHEPV